MCGKRRIPYYSPNRRSQMSTISEFHLNLHQPDRPQFRVYDLENYLQKYGKEATKPHLHSFYQIVWFRSGEGKHVVDFKEYAVTANTLFFIAKNQVHYFDHEDGYTGTLMHFNESFLVQQNSETEFFLKHALFNNPYQQPWHCMDCAISPILDEYLKLIERELAGGEDFGREELLRSYLKAFLIQVQRSKNELENAGEQRRMQMDEQRARLSRFINLIDDNYQRGLTVGEYADSLHVSARTLSNLTNRLLGKTPMQMIQERVILEAQRLLLYSELNINQICYKLGFDDPSYFVKYFKKHAKIAPSEFRHAYKEA